eukprot:TRINITY_DN2439_c0_g1_i4.p1 TRINITY_DN2439_c0_g1~~TRINITY_DN2439_c0_g1_i4.p1  ORF type:complete len:352 (+),score=47.80 TRINITY_DN2439_c0_g1_i4:16-1071(+)
MASLKVVLLGSGGSGKTSLVRRFSSNEFSSTYNPTIGIDFALGSLSRDEKLVSFQFWDIPGQKRFRSGTFSSFSYLHESHAAVLTFDATSQESLDEISGLASAVLQHCDRRCRVVVVACKSDASEARSGISRGREQAVSLGLDFFETSAKTGHGVEALFSALAAPREAPKTHTHQPRHLKLRRWGRQDVDSLPSLANNIKIWRNLRDIFPHPYTTQSAQDWISFNEKTPESSPATNLAICDADSGQLMGGISVILNTNANTEHKAEIGYWLGEQFWGQGVMPTAISHFENYIRSSFPHVRRLEALVFAYNSRSGAVLRKAGFSEEGRLRAYYLKEGHLVDALVFGKVLEAQ